MTEFGEGDHETNEVYPASPKLERKFQGHKDIITALYFSPNDDTLASSSLDCSVMLWSMQGPMRSYRFQGHDQAVMDVAFSPTRKLLASVSRDRTIRIWIPTITGSTGTFKGHFQTIRSVQFSSDGMKVLTASDDKTIKLWSVAKKKFISSYVGHTNWVRCAKLSDNSNVIASCSDDKSVRIWDAKQGQCVHTHSDLNGYGLSLAWHPSDMYIAVGMSNTTVRIYDMRQHKLLQYYKTHGDKVNKVSFHPNGSYLITCSSDNSMKILDLAEGRQVFTLTGHQGAVTAVTFSTSGDCFASGGEDKEVLIWKTNFSDVTHDKENMDSTLSATPTATPSSSKECGKHKTKAVWDTGWSDRVLPKSIKKNLLKSLYRDVAVQFTISPPFFKLREFQTPRTPPAQRNYDVPNISNIESPDTVDRCCQSNRPTYTDSFNLSPRHNTVSDNWTTSSTNIPGFSSDFECTCHEEWGSLVSDKPGTSSRSKSTDAQQKNCLNHNMNRNIDSMKVNQHRNAPHQSHANDSFLSPTLTSATYDVASDNAPTFTISNTKLPSHLKTNLKADDGFLLGMISLKNNEVCYTNGTIEWVTKKRNQGIQYESCKKYEPVRKRFRDQGSSMLSDQGTNCDCVDTVPTINVIVDHLKELHDAIDLVDKRLESVEEYLKK